MLEDGELGWELLESIIFLFLKNKDGKERLGTVRDALTNVGTLSHHEALNVDVGKPTSVLSLLAVPTLLKARCRSNLLNPRSICI